MAWAAGLFEGEGCIHVARDKYGQLSMSSTDRDVLERFCAVVGVGAIYQRAQQKPHHKPAWQWGTGRLSDVQHVLGLLRPWLGVRRGAKADDVLALPALIGRKPDHCNAGHPLVGPGADVYVNAKGWRQCKICRREYDKARAARNRLARSA